MKARRGEGGLVVELLLERGQEVVRFARVREDCAQGALQERLRRAIQKRTRVLVSIWDSLMFGRVLEYLSRYGIR